MPSTDDDPPPPDEEEEILSSMRKRAEGTDLRIPPRCFEEMNAEIQHYSPDEQTLRVRFPAEERYENPTGVMQGGFVCAALDNVLGPLSYLVAPPSATTQLNVTFLRPIGRRHDFFVVEARAEDRAGKQLYLTGKVLTESGKIAATGAATCRILDRVP